MIGENRNVVIQEEKTNIRRRRKKNTHTHKTHRRRKKIIYIYIPSKDNFFIEKIESFSALKLIFDRVRRKRCVIYIQSKQYERRLNGEFETDESWKIVDHYFYKLWIEKTTKRITKLWMAFFGRKVDKSGNMMTECMERMAHMNSDDKQQQLVLKFRRL